MSAIKCGGTTDPMRQEFEAWYAPLFAGGFVANMYVPLFVEGFVPNMPVRENGEYVSSQQQIAWMSWKAAKTGGPTIKKVVPPIQFILEPINPCTHIVGRAWQLNPEEGAAWINRYVDGTGPFPDPNDWNYAFTHCPVCGEALVPPEGVDVITMEDAKWSKKDHEEAQGVGT